MTLLSRPIDFTMPTANVAQSPPERRGLARDGVRLMVAHRGTGETSDGTFTDLVDLLRPGDALVVNNSKTIPASVDAVSEDNEPLRVHFASPLAEGLWSLEVRSPTANGGTVPGPDLAAQTLALEGGGKAHLLARSPRSPRLWIAAVEPADDIDRYLDRFGRPIRYLDGPDWPLADYQTVFATEPGSSEMPSAGRPFTTELVTRLVARGALVLPITLHTGVSSFEDDESPGEEPYRVTETTAMTLNRLREAGGRVIAVGTSVARALETVGDGEGAIHPGEGLTDLVITPERGVRVIDGLLTGWHEPRSSHLRLLEAVTGRGMLQRLYDQALDSAYLWHEFGDELLILR
ncbi:MAG: S-adenosylmethionine:tRNA ribosyltransferase-isomerase [Acidimicrobiia bacterium]